ncbi:MAG: RNA methyltransferase [Chromatiales bacterium]|nr:RNA methyltransferase [Chromatiales bacterium]
MTLNSRNHTLLDNIRIVLVETSHPGNIGAAARAMKNMGLNRLALVNPVIFPDTEASARASGADDVLVGAQVHDNLSDALAGCRLVFGSSARIRSIRWPQVDPAQCARQALAEVAAGDVAIVFGRERTGLTNEEMDRCHTLVHIPCNPDFSSLNVAAAVQVLSYELRKHALSGGEIGETREVADAASMEGFYRHLEQALVELEFLDPTNPRKLMRHLHRLFNRARPEPVEINILRGILSAATGRKSMGGPLRPCNRGDQVE